MRRITETVPNRELNGYSSLLWFVDQQDDDEVVLTIENWLVFLHLLHQLVNSRRSDFSGSKGGSTGGSTRLPTVYERILKKPE